MSKSVVMSCDRCGHSVTNGDSVYWALLVAPVRCKVPPDGMNGGEHNHDLCYPCRKELDELLFAFFQRKAVRDVR